MVPIPFGQDPMEFNEETSASRVGARIRKIRTDKGLLQADLGNMVGLTADRIQKYENGVRKPKADLLKKIADALGVSILALVDPNTTSYIGSMYAFFEMEEHFDVRIEKTSENQIPGLCITVEANNPLYKYMQEWYEVYLKTKMELEAASSEEEKKKILKAYHNWEWTFPQEIVERTSREMQRKELKSKIDELQEAYDKLSDDSE